MKGRSFGAVAGASAFAATLLGLVAPAAPLAHAAVTRAAAASPAALVRPHASVSHHRSDFNNDGFDDLVVPAPGESQGTISRTGAITVMYGSVTGLTSVGS